MAVPTEQLAGDEVDGAAAEDEARVSGKAGCPPRVEVALELAEQGEHVGDDVFVLLVGDVHAPVAQGVVDEALAERAGVADRLGVGLEDRSVVAAAGPDQDRLWVEAGTHSLLSGSVTSDDSSVKRRLGRGAWADPGGWAVVGAACCGSLSFLISGGEANGSVPRFPPTTT